MSEQFSAPTYMKCTNQICVCGKSDEIVGYTLGCGKTEETVEEAIIKFVD